jgi:hypothetical protein
LSSSYFWISGVSIFVFIENKQLMKKSSHFFGDNQQDKTAVRSAPKTRSGFLIREGRIRRRRPASPPFGAKLHRWAGTAAQTIIL